MARGVLAVLLGALALTAVVSLQVASRPPAASAASGAPDQLPGVGDFYDLSYLGAIGQPINESSAALYISSQSKLVIDANSGQEWDFSSGTPVETDYPVPTGNWNPIGMNNSGIVVGQQGTWY